jgi:hypothetical protein
MVISILQFDLKLEISSTINTESLRKYQVKDYLTHLDDYLSFAAAYAYCVLTRLYTDLSAPW